MIILVTERWLGPPISLNFMVPLPPQTGFLLFRLSYELGTYCVERKTYYLVDRN